MDKFFAVVITAALTLTAGCVFDPSGLPVADCGDSCAQQDLGADSKKDGLKPDKGKFDSDMKVADGPSPEGPKPDGLKPDTFDPCKGINGKTCSGNGNCIAGICSCKTGYDDIYCDKCDTGYCGYSTGCQLKPVISSFSIDCSITPGCQTDYQYPVKLYWQNATSYTVTVAIDNKPPSATATPGTLSLTKGTAGTSQPLSGTLSASPLEFYYWTGVTDKYPVKTRVTITVTHSTNPTSCAASASFTVDYV